MTSDLELSVPSGLLRLFVAVEIPDAVKQEVERRMTPLRERQAAAHGTRARWVDPRGLHLTLVFLGDVPADLLPALETALAEAVAPRSRMTLALSGGGTFPPHRPARVAWVGIQAPPALSELQGALVGAAVDAVDHQPEERPFSPHVTLARCREPWPQPAAREFVTAFAGPIGEPFEVAEVVLFRSHLGDSPGVRGARHEVLARFPLAPLAPLVEPGA